MNINFNKCYQNTELLPMFDDQASPYLTPLQGIQSPRSLVEEDNFLQFRLQSEQVQNLEPQISEPQKSSMGEIPKEKLSNKNTKSSQKQKEEGKEVQTLSYISKPSSSKVQSIIYFLVENDQLNSAQLKTLGQPLYEDSASMEFLFQTLMMKFKKLKKTKEEMTKFCMRKAFKFVNQAKRKHKKTNSFPPNQNEYLGGQFQLQMPFKKNSSQKTMNSQFLRVVFNQPGFIKEYRNFLNQLHKLIQEDNENKISYLANTIDSHITNDQIKKVEEIKRLPWTRSILRKTQELAFSMLQFAESSDLQV